MYTLASKLERLPVISLQTGEAVAWAREPIIDMATFEVTALSCEAPGHSHRLVLLPADIRQLAADCIIIDTEDELTDPHDIVRLAAVITAAYSPIGKAVVSDIGRKLGTVEDYTINLDTARIQKLHLRQPLFKSWFSSGLTVDRSQIIDVTPTRIIARDVTIKVPRIQPDAMPEINP